MGGKKKKSTPPVVAVTAGPVGTAAVSSRASAPTVGNGAADEPKKQPGSSKQSKTAKDNKSKGDIKHSLIFFSLTNPSYMVLWGFGASVMQPIDGHRITRHKIWTATPVEL